LAVAELCQSVRGGGRILVSVDELGPWLDLWLAMREVLGPEADHVGFDFARDDEGELKGAFEAHGAWLREEATIGSPATETVADFLEWVEARSPSWTWRVTDDELADAIEVGRRWTLDRYNSIDVFLQDPSLTRWWLFDLR
jgi:hypothetical protein